MRIKQARVLLAISISAATVGGAAVIACGSDSSSGGGAPTSTTPSIPPPPPATTTPPPPVQPPPPPSSDGGDAGTAPATCKEFLAANPGATTGLQTLDVDGPGGLAPFSVWCDMAFDGGGWTLIQSHTGTSSPDSLSAGTLDGGVLVGVPQPLHLGGFSGPVVQAIALKSNQVHIRLSFQSDAGADGGTWVMSGVPDAGDSTLTIKNLRALNVLDKGTDGGFADWTGPKANAATMSWVPDYNSGFSTCGDPVEATKYPSVYWGCGNYTSMNIYGNGQNLASWNYTGGTGNEPMEVYVR